MAEPQKQPGLFARICCCSRNDKEPTVTLIRTNDLTNAPQPSISPAKETVDGFEDQALEVPKEEAGPKEVFRGAAPKWKPENKELEQGVDEIEECPMNMNDVILTDVCGEEQDKPSVEDAVSIRTNVIEEVDESELRQMSEILKKDEEVVESPQTTSRSGEMVTLQQMLIDGYETPRLEEKPTIEVTPAEEPRDKLKEEQEFREMQNMTRSEEEEDSELEEEIVHETQSTAPIASPRSILKASSSQPSTARSEESEDRQLSPPPTPLSPPPETEVLEGLHHAVMVNVEDEPKKPSSMMYADAESDSEESSDDEAEALPPVAKPEDDKTDLEESDEEKSEKENRVTRLSVKSNGQATMTTGNIRVALESVEITDDEFSEKLI